MNKFKTRIEKIEEKISFKREPLVFAMTNFADYAEVKHFKDENEKEAFLKWRTQLFIKESENQDNQFYYYDFSLSDVKAYLQRFRHEQETKNTQ